MNIEFVKSELTDIKHAFFTRHGGLSKGSFESLNVSKGVGDDTASVENNRLLALERAKIEKSKFVFLGKLEHSNRIQEVGAAAGGMEFNDHDALITNTPGLALGLSTADCLPIILVDEEAPALAVVHAGWKGLKVEVIRHSLDALSQEFSAKPDRIKAIIGPSIGPSSYEVTHDMLDQFDSRYFNEINEHLFLNLWSLAVDQLSSLGIKKVDNLEIDTFNDDRFYSHRKSAGATGRFLTLASL